MLHQTELGNARMEALLTSAHRVAQTRELKNRGSPREHPVRHLLAVPLVLIGAMLNGAEPDVIGRVVIRDRGGHLPPGVLGAA